MSPWWENLREKPECQKLTPWEMVGKVRFSMSPCMQLSPALKHTVAHTVRDSSLISLRPPPCTAVPSIADLGQLPLLTVDFPLCRALSRVCENTALRSLFLTNNVQYTFQSIWSTSREQYRVHGWCCALITTISRTFSSSQAETLNLLNTGSLFLLPSSLTPCLHEFEHFRCLT